MYVIGPLDSRARDEGISEIASMRNQGASSEHSCLPYIYPVHGLSHGLSLMCFRK